MNTKANGRKSELDSFYTKSEIVDLCLKHFQELYQFLDYDLIIDPSAGNGAFNQKLPPITKAYDIEPMAANIEKLNWFNYTPSFSKLKILVIGNPPFGEQGSLAIDFFNHAANFAKTIAFIFPASFAKPTMQNQLNLSFHLKNQFILPKDSFIFQNKSYSVPTVFQIWNKENYLRTKYKGKTKTLYFDFVSANEADFSIRRVGGAAGKARLSTNYAAASNYFIKMPIGTDIEKEIEFINSLDFPLVQMGIVGSLSKDELIRTYEQMKGL